MKFATQNLPADYQEARTLDISRDTRLLLALNVAGLVIMLISGWFFYHAMHWLRPEETSPAVLFLSIRSIRDLAMIILAILGLTAGNLILHEGVHGVFFWLFTHSMPRFAFRGAYAYAAAPGWYIFRNPFLVTTLAPLGFISLAGLVVMRLVPPAGLAATWFVVTLNASGAVGDLLVAWWILRQAPQSLIQDRGDVVTLYLPNESGNSPI